MRSQPPHFRHELVSALLLDADTDLLADVAERDLVVYLALAHHGKVRLAVRAVVGEAEGVVLGVRDGSITRPAGLPDGSTLPSRTLSLAPLRLGPGSFMGRALRLRDRDDLGVFRLALCEALVRCADWRASRGPTEGTTA